MSESDDYPGFHIDGSTVDDMELDGEAVVLNLETQGYFGLNATGTEVWALIKAHPGITAATIAEHLAQRYGGDATAVAADVAAVLEDLQRESLVATCPAGNGGPRRPDPTGEPYLVPRLDPYGELDTLILSGE